MKIDVTQKLYEDDGTEMKQQDEPGKTVTLRTLAVAAMNYVANGEQLSFEESVRRHKLVRKITKHDVLELKSEDVTLLKNQLAKRFPPPLLCGQACMLLEGEAYEVAPSEAK